MRVTYREKREKGDILLVSPCAHVCRFSSHRRRLCIRTYPSIRGAVLVPFLLGVQLRKMLPQFLILALDCGDSLLFLSDCPLRRLEVSLTIALCQFGHVGNTTTETTCTYSQVSLLISSSRKTDIVMPWPLYTESQQHQPLEECENTYVCIQVLA